MLVCGALCTVSLPLEYLNLIFLFSLPGVFIVAAPVAIPKMLNLEREREEKKLKKITLVQR